MHTYFAFHPCHVFKNLTESEPLLLRLYSPMRLLFHPPLWEASLQLHFMEFGGSKGKKLCVWSRPRGFSYPHTWLLFPLESGCITPSPSWIGGVTRTRVLRFSVIRRDKFMGVFFSKFSWGSFLEEELQAYAVQEYYFLISSHPVLFFSVFHFRKGIVYQ